MQRRDSVRVGQTEAMLGEAMRADIVCDGVDEMASADRENLDAAHVSRYAAKEDARASAARCSRT